MCSCPACLFTVGLPSRLLWSPSSIFLQSSLCCSTLARPCTGFSSDTKTHPKLQRSPLGAGCGQGGSMPVTGGNAGLQGLRPPALGSLLGLRGCHALSEQTATETSSHTMPTGHDGHLDRLHASPGGGEGEDSSSPSSPRTVQLGRAGAELWVCCSVHSCRSLRTLPPPPRPSVSPQHSSQWWGSIP